MQKIKNESGITLIATAVTIIVAIILAGVAIYTGYSSISESEDQRDEADLEIVQQAVVAQYAKATRLGVLKTEPMYENKGDKPDVWKGTILDATDTIQVNYITEDIDWVSKSFAYYEDYYYRLDENDLFELGITNSKDVFIVNYKTGEVYNETKKNTSSGKALYIKSISYDVNTEIVDTTFSNDDI